MFNLIGNYALLKHGWPTLFRLPEKNVKPHAVQC